MERVRRVADKLYYGMGKSSSNRAYGGTDNAPRLGLISFDTVWINEWAPVSSELVSFSSLYRAMAFQDDSQGRFAAPDRREGEFFIL